MAITYSELCFGGLTGKTVTRKSAEADMHCAQAYIAEMTGTQNASIYRKE